MKIKSEYKLREVAGETIIVNQGTIGVDMTRIISLNTTARMLWEALCGKNFTTEEAASLLVEKYGIAEDQALADASRWVERLKECGGIVE